MISEGNENLRICLQGNNTLERGATMEEVTEAIKTMKSGKAPGLASFSDGFIRLIRNALAPFCTKSLAD